MCLILHHTFTNIDLQTTGSVTHNTYTIVLAYLYLNFCVLAFVFDFFRWPPVSIVPNLALGVHTVCLNCYCFILRPIEVPIATLRKAIIHSVLTLSARGTSLYVRIEKHL